METQFYDILKHFDISIDPSVYGNGHINDTYIVHSQPNYILQRINKRVFKNPPAVMENIQGVTEFLRKKIESEGGDPDRETLNLIPTVDGKSYYLHTDGEYYRVYKFVDGAVSYDAVESSAQLYHAAKAFGKFQNMLAEYPAEKLHETIVDFHNTRVRYDQFREALEKNASGRAGNCRPEIDFVLAREKDAGVIVDALADGSIPLRVTHNDTKLNNVLISEETGKGICVIDLDTVMPGLPHYDFGDMVRTGTSPAAEDEKDLTRVRMRFEMFEALLRGYLSAAGQFLNPLEKSLLPFSGKLITLEIGIRFLTDYLSGDVYFKVKRPGHNLDRCRTQFKLVSSIEEQFDAMRKLTDSL